MRTQMIAEIEKAMQTCLSSVQMEQLHNVLLWAQRAVQAVMSRN